MPWTSLGTKDDSVLGGKRLTCFLDLKDAKRVEYDITGGSYPTVGIYSVGARISSSHAGFPS